MVGIFLCIYKSLGELGLESLPVYSGDSRNVGEPGHNFEGNFINPISEYNNI
jgi:hypothetical protein